MGSAVNPTCFGVNNGSLDLSVSGGTAPYSYAWSNGATTSSNNNLAPGSYYFTVTDAHFCDARGMMFIYGPDEILLSATITPASCPTALDGSINLTVSGGTPFYSYLWSNSATTEDITGLAPGSYMVTVTDGNGCTKSGTFNVGEASPICTNISVTGDVTTAVCYNAYNTITVAGDGNYFTVMSPNGDATFIAGVKISFMPGTTVQLGGKMHGSITPDGSYCPGKMPTLPAVVAGQDQNLFSIEQAFFSIYPNPTTGNFTLVQKGDKLYGNVKVDVYNMRGVKVMTDQMIGEKSHEFSFSGIPVGLYFVKVVADDYVETIKLIISR